MTKIASPYTALCDNFSVRTAIHDNWALEYKQKNVAASSCTRATHQLSCAKSILRTWRPLKQQAQSQLHWLHDLQGLKISKQFGWHPKERLPILYDFDQHLLVPKSTMHNAQFPLWEWVVIMTNPNQNPLPYLSYFSCQHRLKFKFIKPRRRIGDAPRRSWQQRTNTSCSNRHRETITWGWKWQPTRSRNLITSSSSQPQILSAKSRNHPHLKSTSVFESHCKFLTTTSIEPISNTLNDPFENANAINKWTN